jgi:hypothetical protein
VVTSQKLLVGMKDIRTLFMLIFLNVTVIFVNLNIINYYNKKLQLIYERNHPAIYLMLIARFMLLTSGRLA